MLVSKATTGLFRNALCKAENVVSLGIIRCTQNTSQTKHLYFVHKRYKNTSSDEKKHHEEKPKKSRKLVKLATIAVAGTTVAVIAAKYDDDFRDWTREHVPALDSLVKIIFQEEDTYLESLNRAHKQLSAWIKSALYDLYQGIKGTKQGKPSSTFRDDKLGALPPLEPCEDSKKPYKPPESAFLIKGDDDKKEESTKPGQVPKELKDLKDLEDKLCKSAQDTIHTAAGDTVCALKDTAHLLDYLDQIISADDPRLWDKIRKVRHDAIKGMEKSKSSLVNFKALEKQLTSKLKDNTSLSDDVKAKAQNYLNTVTKDVKDAMDKLEKTKENTVLAKHSWDKVKQARLYFSEELETLFPNVWLNDEKLNIPADQIGPFVEKVLNDINYLGRQHAKQETIYNAELNSATEKLKNKDPKGLEGMAEVLIPYEIGKVKKKHREELQKHILAHKAKCQKNTKDQMKQTAEVYGDLTNEALKLKEKEVERKMQLQLEEKLAQARAEHNIEIAKMIGRMQGANEAISKRGEKDVGQQNKQQFWSAAQSLMAAVKPIGAAAQGQEPKPLKNEITNLNKVKPEGDELVENVLNSIPQEAVERGVPSEASLREKFIKVMRNARGWAGVPPGEITLLQLLLAKVQSALYLNVAIPQTELDNEPVIDPEKLNNYDILHRAKYYVDRGDFDQAIRYLNLLKGPSSQVASDWAKDALMYLETRQAAEVLLAHATAASMQP